MTDLFSHHIAPISQQHILLSIHTTHNYGSSLHLGLEALWKKLPCSLLSPVQNVAKSIQNDIHIAMATFGDSFQQVWFSSVSFKETLVLSARRSDRSHRCPGYYQVYLASHIRICLLLVCTSGQQTKNTLTKECSLYSAVLFLTSIYRSTWTCQCTFYFPTLPCADM